MNAIIDADLMQFIGYNILLNNGKTTRGDAPLLADSLFMKAIRSSIIRFFPELAEGRKLRAVDLAAMEGGYSVELARMGFDTLGIDARKENLFKANYVKFNTGLPHLEFKLDDVRNLAKYGRFDLTLCLGILYHMDHPAEFLRMLYQQTGKMLVLHSFYAPEHDLVHDFRGYLRRFRFLQKKRSGVESYQKVGISEEEMESSPAYISHLKTYQLGRLTRHEGYAGRWYKEWSEKHSKAHIEAQTEAAYNNSRSFWFCKEELVRALYDAGFSTVYEQHDPVGDFHAQYPSKFYGRTLLIALK